MSDQTQWAHEAMRREALRAREDGRNNALSRRRFADDSAFAAENAVSAMGLPAVMDGLRQCRFRDRLLLARL